MHVFAHLHKCAGTSVVDAARESGIRLPPRHRNGHPAGPDGHGVAGLASLSEAELAARLAPLVQAGVQLVAIEWDFPPVERFPTHWNLRFFTILRDPIERLLSNYAYDVVSGFTTSRTLQSYLGEGGIWTCANYYTRFFAGLSAHQAVGPEHLDYVLHTLRTRFAFAFAEDDLFRFVVGEVGLPIRRLRRANRTNRLLKLLHRASISPTPEALGYVTAANDLDLRLCAALRTIKR